MVWLFGQNLNSTKDGAKEVELEPLISADSSVSPQKSSSERVGVSPLWRQFFFLLLIVVIGLAFFTHWTDNASKEEPETLLGNVLSKARQALGSYTEDSVKDQSRSEDARKLILQPAIINRGAEIVENETQIEKSEQPHQDTGSPSWSPTSFTKHPTRIYRENWKNGPSLQCEEECCGTHLAQLTRRVMHKTCIYKNEIVIVDKRPRAPNCVVFQCVQKCMNPGRIKLRYVEPSVVAHLPVVDKTVYVLPASNPGHLWHVLWSLIPGFTMLWKVFGNEMGLKAEVVLEAITSREDGHQVGAFQKSKSVKTYPWLSLYRTDFPIQLRLHMDSKCYKDMIYGHPPFWSQHEDEITYENAMFFKNWLVSPNSGADLDQAPFYKPSPPMGVKPVTEFWRDGDPALPKLLFLRRKSSRFLMNKDGKKNSDEIISALTENGRVNVAWLYAEDYSVQDQLAATKGADILMAAHGQGLAWGCWLHDGGVIIEILPMTADHGWTNYGQSGNFDIVIPFRVSRLAIHGRAFSDPKWQGKSYKMIGRKGHWISSPSAR